MDPRKKARLESAGWKVGDYAEFLELSDEERAVVELRLELARSIRERRTASGMTQAELAERLGTTQPRVTKIESAASDVSLDVLIRGFLAVGGRIPRFAKPTNRRMKATN